MPFAGFLFDAYCSYDSGFLLMGAMIALSGAMLYPIPCIRNALSEVRMAGEELFTGDESDVLDPSHMLCSLMTNEAKNGLRMKIRIRMRIWIRKN